MHVECCLILLSKVGFDHEREDSKLLSSIFLYLPLLFKTMGMIRFFFLFVFNQAILVLLLFSLCFENKIKTPSFIDRIVF